MKRFAILAALAVALFASTADARHRARRVVVVQQVVAVPVVSTVATPAFVLSPSLAVNEVVAFDAFGRRAVFVVDVFGRRQFLRYAN